MAGTGSKSGGIPKTTFVEAEAWNFRAVVQKLTGASEEAKLPLSVPSRFKLHERRNATAKKVEVPMGMSVSMAMASPVSPLDDVMWQEEEERAAIADKGFYLHPSTPRPSHPPQLLPLFPLHSPTHP
ncbi:hypothetical protein VNO78_24615 [Psophocarpus tetragonolobus]|uniref:VQ domain-containing protein n=1 Tax=Psophocarpus tetragonolobus TaxID=3891 RepID=A0AAN9S8H3_PSOTE